MNRLGRFRLAVVTAAVVAAGVSSPTGCTRPTGGQSKDKGKADGPKADPWDALAKRLRKDNDPAAVKTALGQLATDLADRTDVPRPAALDPAAEKALAAVAGLTPGDLETVRPAGYSGLDAAYVADAFYLRDAARALDPAGLPPADLARVGFAWVCRQVYLNPWRLDDGTFVPAVPPVYVLRRGYGTGLERAYVFLALLQQMGIDGCLVGPPDAAGKPTAAARIGSDGKPLAGIPPGPFWAVGARVGGDIFLFDPWRGVPFPGPDGNGVGTLAQVKMTPAQIKAWLDDKTWAVTADDVKQSAVILAAPLSALSPRMALLDEKLKAETGVRLALDPAAVRDRFLTEVVKGPAFPVAKVAYWSAPNDGLTYSRVLASFLPADEGGNDRAELPQRLLTRYQRSQFPRAVFNLPPNLDPQAADRLVNGGISAFYVAFFTAPTPRERMQRGQIQDATRYLIDKQDGYLRGLDRLLAADPEAIAAWAGRANAAYADKRRARYPDPLQTQPQPDSDPAVAAAEAAVEEFWKSQGQTAQVVIDQSMAKLGLGEASFLLALAKHEEAERQQVRLDRAAAGADADRAKAAAAAAWDEAANAWRSYQEQAPTLPALPGRAAHADALTERAKARAAAK